MEKLSVLKAWLLENLVLGNSKEENRKFKLLSDEYKPRSSYRITYDGLCSKFNLNGDERYNGYNSVGVMDMVPIIQSIECFNLFKSATRPDSDDEEGYNSSFDSKRFSMYESDLINHPRYSDIEPVVEYLREQVIEFGKSVDERIAYSAFTVLFSSAGGEKQDLHIDEIRAVKKDKSIHSVIVALETGTMLDFSKNINDANRHTLHMEPGSFILFHGKQSHGGAAYSKPNIRFHFYLHHEENALDVFKKGYRAALFSCEACDVNDGRPLNCPLKFETLSDRSAHYRDEHEFWWVQYKKFRSAWKESFRKTNLARYKRTNRQKLKKIKENELKQKEIEQVEDETKEINDSDSDNSDNPNSSDSDRSDYEEGDVKL